MAVIRRRVRKLPSAPPLPGRLAELAALPDVPIHPLRLLLLRKGLTFEDAADLLGWSVRNIKGVIEEWREPPPPMATVLGPRAQWEAIARAVGVPLQDLFPPPPAAVAEEAMRKRALRRGKK